MANENGFKDIYGFAPVKGDRYNIELAIISANLHQIAGKFYSASEKIRTLTKPYIIGPPATDVPKALETLAAVDAAVKERQQASDSWTVAVQAVKDASYLLSLNLDDYAPSLANSVAT